MINVSNLIFEYPGLRALDNVSFSIPKGSITALVGPNGAGKTTLLRCMAALDQPVSGDIRIDTVDVLELPRECHRLIGYLSDFFGLYDRLTVRQCLHYVAGAQGIDEERIDGVVKDVSQRLHIEDRLDRRPSELSRGLRQRLAIAQAIIHEPKVVLLDEPASGLDPEARHDLAGLFLDLQKQGMTLLVSSHILAELEAYSTDMLVLRAGRIVEQVAIKHKSQQKPFKLVLASGVDNLAERLSLIKGITLLKSEHNHEALLQLDGDVKAHEVLKNLIASGLEVSEFYAVNTNLQDAYLQTIKVQP